MSEILTNPIKIPSPEKSDRSHVVLWAKELVECFVFLRPLGLRLAFYFLYKRYFPVPGARFIALNDLKLDKIKIIDVRDFNESYKNPITGAANIPIAYLKRNLKDIPNDLLHVVGSSDIEINIGIRFLKQKGFRVNGYTILENNPLPMKETCW